MSVVVRRSSIMATLVLHHTRGGGGFNPSVPGTPKGLTCSACDRLAPMTLSIRPVPAKYSLLSARVVNPTGGNTEFADMRAAYDSLDAATKALIENLVCEHSLMYSRGSLGMLDYSDEERAMFRPVRQKLVRTHPVSGRTSLYLSSHAGAILGMPMPEARILLRDLTEHATQPAFVYVHGWRSGDLVMWDNRQMIHRV